MEPAYPKPTRATKTRKPLRRSKPMRRRRPRRLDGGGSDLPRLGWIHEQPCMLYAPRAPAASMLHCGGPVEAHHAGKNPGVGMKADDSTTVPLCRKHHGDLTAKLGVFKFMKREDLRELQDEWIAETTARYLSHGSRRR